MAPANAAPKPRKMNAFEFLRTYGFVGLTDFTKPLASILKVVVVLIILGATAGLLFTSIADIVSAVTTNSTNNTTADLLRPVFGLIIAVTGLILIVRKVLEAAK